MVWRGSDCKPHVSASFAISELSSAYLLEKLLANGREAGIEAEVGEGTDPDTWVETPYALRQPCSLHEETGEPMCKLGLDGTWQRPWADVGPCMLQRYEPLPEACCLLHPIHVTAQMCNDVLVTMS